MIFFYLFKPIDSYLYVLYFHEPLIRYLINLHSFQTLCLGAIGTDHVLSEPCYKKAVVQRSFPYDSVVKYHGATT